MAPPKVVLVLSGGVALGAYQAGAYAALHEREDLPLERLAGASIGAVNAALIAGNAPAQRVDGLRAFWEAAALDLGWTLPAGPLRHLQNWLSVAQARLFGRPELFVPRPELAWTTKATSVYDPAPFRATIERFVDFERLNRSAPSFCLVATDVENGDEVIFDTARGERITPEHLVATCGFLPDFPPVELGGRLLGDGSLAAHMPVEAALRDAREETLCLVVDLFCAEGPRPATLEQAAARRWDLLFANQTRQALKRVELERRAQRDNGGSAAPLHVVHLSYRAPGHEAGPEKPFDFSRATLGERWKAGYGDMVRALRDGRHAERFGIKPEVPGRAATES
jgi:NTE family protein